MLRVVISYLTLCLIIKSGTTVSNPTAGNKECNDIKSHLPTTKRLEQCPWPEILKNA
jgi:hypothetical protein